MIIFKGNLKSAFQAVLRLLRFCEGPRSIDRNRKLSQKIPGFSFAVRMIHPTSVLKESAADFCRVTFLRKIYWRYHCAAADLLFFCFHQRNFNRRFNSVLTIFAVSPRHVCALARK